MNKLIFAIGFLLSLGAHADEPVRNSFCSDSAVHNFTIQTESDGYFVIYNHSSQTFVKNDAGVDLAKGVVLNVKEDSTRPFIGFGDLHPGDVVVIKQRLRSVVIEGDSVYLLQCGA